MGIRINKAIGYGLTDLQCMDGRITDPRINMESPLLDPEGFSIDPYLDHLRNVEQSEQEESNAWSDAGIELSMLETAFEDGDGHVDRIIHNAEYGLAEVLLVIPPARDEWHRYGDVIDYAEEGLWGEAPNPRVGVLENGIFPYSDLHVDIRDQGQLHPSLRRMLKKLRDSQAADDFAKANNFSNLEEAPSCIVPVVPFCVSEFTTWGRLFNNPEDCHQLRPLVYTWWS